uniref:Uncharacterized protein n=1 Tax=Avena sativa TaxID=4498 RepID=A0ACD5ZZF0_AVESA
MQAKAAALLTNGAYAWFERSPGLGIREDRALMQCALFSSFIIVDNDIHVTDYYPEPYMVRFIHHHHRREAVECHDFLFGEHKVHVRPWRWEEHDDHVDFKYHVRLCIENVPMYAWNDLVAQQVIGRACSLDYIEPQCQSKEYTKALCLWAWAKHPAKVQRVRWATLPGRSGTPRVPERGRRGLGRRCIIHPYIVEDMTGSVDAQPPMPGKGEWRWGHVDGERSVCDTNGRLRCGDGSCQDRWRREKDTNECDKRGRNNSRSWRERLRRSLSHGPKSNGGPLDQGRQRDHSSNRDGGRRCQHGAELVLVELAPG